MFRHLSPKTTTSVKPQQPIKPKQTMVSPPALFTPKLIKKQILDKPLLRKEKEVKNLGNLLNSKPLPQKPAPNLVNLNKSSETKKQLLKNISAFDDYYQKKPKLTQVKSKKQQFSMSGDSYQSQNFNGLKKSPQSPKSLAAQKYSAKGKNLVSIPLIGAEDKRNGFKSPGTKPQNRSESDDDKTGKRILSFGGKKIMPNKFLQDGDNVSKKSGNANIGTHTPSSPTFQSKLRFQGLDVSDQQLRKETVKQNTSNDQKNKGKTTGIGPACGTKNLPKFISNANNIKSSPYLTKFALDSSNQISGDRKILKAGGKPGEHKPDNKPKFEPLLQQLRNKQKQSKQHEEDKSLSFNKGQMFLNLKKRQQRHSLLCKEINMLGLKVEMKIMSSEGDKAIQFTLIKKINQSKRTGIFLGHHDKTASLYCFKRIPISEIKKNMMTQVIRQHKIHQYCYHPHIVRSFFSAYDATHLYLTMEFMQGQTLGLELRAQVLKSMSQQNVNKNKINQSVTTQISKINKVRKILYQIATAVAYLHEKSIIHRDIKPDNIFISHQIYKLGDFGSSAPIGSLQYVGTLDYAAPEIITQAPYDQKVDIWSLGCIAYQLDVGRPPFFHINPQQTKRLITFGQYDRSLIGDAELRNMIQRMLQNNKKMRISAKDMLKNQFFQNLPKEGSLF